MFLQGCFPHPATRNLLDNYDMNTIIFHLWVCDIAGPQRLEGIAGFMCHGRTPEQEQSFSSRNLDLCVFTSSFQGKRWTDFWTKKSLWHLHGWKSWKSVRHIFSHALCNEKRARKINFSLLRWSKRWPEERQVRGSTATFEIRLYVLTLDRCVSLLHTWPINIVKLHQNEVAAQSQTKTYGPRRPGCYFLHRQRLFFMLYFFTSNQLETCREQRSANATDPYRQSSRVKRTEDSPGSYFLTSGFSARPAPY